MRDLDAAWIAGIIEGEGHISARTNGCRNGVTVYIQIQVNMTDHDVLELCQRRTGMGKVRGPYFSKKPNHKPCWKWTVQRTAEVEAMLEAILPWMGERRKEAIFKAIENRRLSIELRTASRMANGKKRPTHCNRGHLFAPDNTHMQAGGRYTYRRCRACGRERYHAAKARCPHPGTADVPVVV